MSAPSPIIIPTCTPGNLRACLDALLEHGEGDRVVVVIDSTPSMNERWRTYLATSNYPHIQVVDYPIDEPFVWSKAINMGLDLVRDIQSPGVILLNDDAELATLEGFKYLDRLMESRYERNAIISAAVDGIACSPNQRVIAREPGEVRIEENYLGFIAVMLGQQALETIGQFDERFDGYGQDDVDYCIRARASQVPILVATAVKVYHDGRLPSTYRTRADISKLVGRAKQRMRDKYKGLLP